jgi:nucleoside-diphosphate-sugar epimerase
MRVFLTGATGFIGSFLVPELVDAGHHVPGLSRSGAGAGAAALTPAGAEVFRGDVNDPDRLRTATEATDGVIHTAFNHDFCNLKQNSEDDRKVIEALGQALARTVRSSSPRAALPVPDYKLSLIVGGRVSALGRGRDFAPGS